MKSKKWFIIFAAALLSVFLVWIGINIVVDPFGIFSDRFYNWDAYSQTLNPRLSKVQYVTERFNEFDSYVIGSSSAASYDPVKLGGYTGGKYYNMFHYGADTEYDRQLVEYLIRNDDDVKNIFLVLGIHEANTVGNPDKKLSTFAHYGVTGENPVMFYAKYLFANLGYATEKFTSYNKNTLLPQDFDVFVPETGCYDKRVRDVEPISSAEEYFSLHSAELFYTQDDGDLQKIDECVKNVKAISKICKDNGINLTVVMTPVNILQLGGFSSESINEYLTRIAEVTDCWNFAISPVSYDHRFFYDSTHTRNDLADMVIAKIYGDTEKYIPDNFGMYCEGSFESSVDELKALALTTTVDTYTKNIPILLYHHLAEESDGGGTLSIAQFKHQLQLITQNGYTAVMFDDVINYVEKGTPLPEKPVIITFDDGYTSNYEAFSLIEKYGCTATVFAIGSSVGRDTYKDTAHSIIPHFDGVQAKKMTDSGVFSIQSHTYDMHQAEQFETGDCVRPNIMPLKDETEADYIKALSKDIEKQHTLFSKIGLEKPAVLAFPGGEHDTLPNVVLRSYGYKATITTNEAKINTAIKGLSQSLYDMGRLNITSYVSDEMILDYLSS